MSGKHAIDDINHSQLTFFLRDESSIPTNLVQGIVLSIHAFSDLRYITVTSSYPASKMAGACVQSVTLPAGVACMSRSRFRGSRGSRRAAGLICNPRSHPLRLQGYSGLQCSNILDCKSKSGHDFHSLVAAYISAPKGKAIRGVAVAMFERFTEKAIKVIMLAQEEARRLGHNFVGTEQILLGLIGEGTGIAAKVLKSMGINLKDARVEVEKIIGRGSGFVAVEIPFTPRAKRVLELSLEEARQLGIS